jgi:hypothetical protein
MNLVYFSQEDSRWRNIMYSNHGDKAQTIGTSACGPTSAAMAISSLTGKEVLPSVAAAYAIKNGYRTYNDGTAWGFFASIAKEYDLECSQTGNLDTVKIALTKGALVVASMGPGHLTGGGHYILLVGIAGKWIDVYDPNHDNTKYGTDGLIDQGAKNDGKIKADELVFRKEARQYWIFNSKEDQPMTKEEKQAFEKLEKKVDELTSAVGTLIMQVKALSEQAPAPKWFVTEFGSDDLNGRINDPKLTSEGWRTLAISMRVGK